jgi:hypothetical protein
MKVPESHLVRWPSWALPRLEAHEDTDVPRYPNWDRTYEDIEVLMDTDVLLDNVRQDTDTLMGNVLQGPFGSCSISCPTSCP